jgi:uncharacterized DUF497 family protein
LRREGRREAPERGCPGISQAYTAFVAEPPPLSEVLAFEWDAGNRGENWERHRVSDGECEEVFIQRPLLVADDPRHSAEEPRHLALGRTRTGRRLLLSFTVRQGRVRVISARDMSRKERKSYDEAIGEGKVESDPEVP